MNLEVLDNGLLRFRWPDEDLVLQVECLGRWKPDEALAQCQVLIGGDLFEPYLLNLANVNDRGHAAARFAGLNGHQPVVWGGNLSDVYQRIVDEHEHAHRILRRNTSGTIHVADYPEPAPTEDLVEGLIPFGKVTSAYGPGGVGKGFWDISLAIALLTGRDFLDLRCLQLQAVLYLDWEEDWDEFQRRAYAVSRGLGLDGPPEGLFYRECTAPIAEIRDELLAEIDSEQIGLAIVDSIGSASQGDLEFSRAAIDTMQALRDFDTTVLAIDHEPKEKGRGQYGSVYKRNLSRSQIHLESVGRNEDGITIKLEHSKLNSGPLQDPIYADLKFQDRSVILERANTDDVSFQHPTNAMGRVIAALDELGEATPKAISEKTGYKVRYVNNKISELAREGRIVEIGRDGHQKIWALSGEDAEDDL